MDGFSVELRSRGAALVRRLLPLGLLPLLVACTQSNGSTTSANSPTITNLRVGYVPATPVTGQPVQIVFLFDVVDPNGDWVGGTCDFTTGSVANIPIQAQGVAANATSGTGECVVSGTFTNTNVQVDLIVIDKAGNASNTLSGTVSVEKPSQL